MTKGDLIVERGAAFLEELSRKVAADGGFAARFAEPLAEDAAFLRKLKPSLVAARLRGEAPANGRDGSVPAAPPSPAPASAAPEEASPTPEASPSAFSSSQAEPKPKPKPDKGGPNPFLVAGAAFAAGVLLAKLIDWRGHAHPRD
jgi:hypothetical protein